MQKYDFNNNSVIIYSIKKFVCYICPMKNFCIFLCLFFMFSCGQYRAHQKIVKSTDPDFKYTQAVNYYNNEDYGRALQLFEDILIDFKNTDQSENVYYYYIYSNFYMKDYLSTAYHANNFTSTFLLSAKNEEMDFLKAYCYYLDSPRSTLDQENTYKAIDELQFFIEKHPESDSLNRANELIVELNQKLAKKHYEIAKLYHETGKFEAAISAIDSYITSFPETSLLESISFVQVKAYYELGKNSIEEKQEQRIKEAIFACNNFLIAFPSGVHAEEATMIYEKLKAIQNGL